MKTAIVDAIPEPGGQLAVLYPEKYIFDVPGYPQILARDLVKSLFEQATRYNPTLYLGERATDLKRNHDNTISVITDKRKVDAKSVLITAGVGSFSPNKLDIANQEKFEGNGIFYFVGSKDYFRGKDLLIVGGGDSAVDWALNLKSVTRSITLVHRRDQFRAHEQSVKELYTSPEITVKTFTESKSVFGDGKLEGAVIFDNRSKRKKRFTLIAS